MVEYFTGGDYSPITFGEIAERMDLAPGSKGALEATLLELERRGVVAHIDGRGWFNPAQEGWQVGRLSLSRKGAGFVRPAVRPSRDEESEDFFVPGRRLQDAHDGDLVLFKSERPRRGGRDGRSGGKPSGRGAKSKGKGSSDARRDETPELREAKVLQVLQRGRKLIRGRFYRKGKTGLVEPDQRSVREVLIPAGKLGGAHNGDTVLVRLSDAPNSEGLPRGEVLAVVTDQPDYQEDLDIIVAEYDFRTDFPAPVIDEAESFPSEISQEVRADRTDVRSRPTITIDPRDAKDFDDAISIERRPDGAFELWVFIADVCAYVKAGSAIDREAEARATSIYLPAKVIPMLPPRLSEDLCSLRPEVDRLAKSVRLVFEPNGSVRSIDLDRVIMRSDRRFTYSEIARVLEGEVTLDAPYQSMVEAGNELRAILRGRREHGGGLNLEIESQRVLLDDEGEVSEVVVEKGDHAHQLVEECMLAANDAVASEARRRKIPILYRAHTEPLPEAVEDFVQFCEVLLPKVKVRGIEDFSKAIEAAHGTPIAPVVNYAILRTLTRAEYSHEPLGHFALAKEDYCHFTSPIRRYPDLIVHRALDALVFGEKMSSAWPRQRDSLETLAAHCSDRERQAEEAEREMTKMRVIAWLKPHEGEPFEGVITAVFEFGFFVRLDQNLAEGLVHVTSLDDYYDLQAKSHRLRPRRGGPSFGLGDRIVVELAKADIGARQLELHYLGSEFDEAGSGERDGRGRSQAKSASKSGLRRRR